MLPRADLIGRTSYLNTGLPSVSPSLGQVVEGLFRLGPHEPCLARDRRHAWAMELCRRTATVAARALVSEVASLPASGSIVRVSGRLVCAEDGPVLWVRELEPVALADPQTCPLDLAGADWVIDAHVVDQLAQLWASLDTPYRELVNAVLADPGILRGFFTAPGSLRHHDAVPGGCVAHTLRVATMASAMCELSTELNRDLLLTGAIVHDIGKSIEYSRNPHGRWTMTRFGRRVGHKIGGALLVAAAANQCPGLAREHVEDVLHMVTASFAPAWAGYRFPETPEAAALSAIDRLCAGSPTRH